jgi:hypothetical protein
MRTPRSTHRRACALAALAVATGTATTVAVTAPSATAAAGLTATVYDIVKEGFTADDGARLASTFGIGNAVRSDGSFAFTNAKVFNVVPSKLVTTTTDENGNKVTVRALNEAALDKITTIPTDDAIAKLSGVVSFPDYYEARPVAGYTTVEIGDVKGAVRKTHDIDTTVSYQLSLKGVPLVGPGAKTRVSLSGAGDIISYTAAIREVVPSADVPILDPTEAFKLCVEAYGGNDSQSLPRLVYYSPPLSSKGAVGTGAAKQLLPHYQCQVKGGSEETGRLIPAAPQLAPKVGLTVTGSKGLVTAKASSRGTGPFTFGWQSSSTSLNVKGSAISYSLAPREGFDNETLKLTVTDANGVATTLAVTLPGGEGTATASGQGGTGVVGGELASNGIESPITEWQCAQDSANGFRSTMLAKGHAMSFDWRGNNAWSWDFKDQAQGGGDASYIDAVDAAWYTGHGWPGGFTFNNGQPSVTPDIARWGDDNLEWLQLESCQVLQDTTGTLDHFDRWGQAFRGLHLLNGFHTNAYCDSRTGGRFASYLFPETFLWWETRPAFTVVQAWSSMANDLEPSGVRWRSMSPMSGAIHNLDDKYWGRGNVGPDIRPGGSYPLTGFISVSGLT